MNTVRGFVEALHKASRDSRVRGVPPRPSTLESPYWGKVQEMRDAITAFRKSGKKVTAFLEYGGDRETTWRVRPIACSSCRPARSI